MGCGPTVALGQIVGQRRECRVKLGSTGTGWLITEDLSGQLRAATSPSRDVVVKGLQNAEPPAPVQSLTVCQQVVTSDGVVRGSVQHTEPDAGCALGGRAGRSVEQRRD